MCVSLCGIGDGFCGVFMEIWSHGHIPLCGLLRETQDPSSEALVNSPTGILLNSSTSLDKLPQHALLLWAYTTSSFSDKNFVRVTFPGAS